MRYLLQYATSVDKPFEEFMVEEAQIVPRIGEQVEVAGIGYCVQMVFHKADSRRTITVVRVK
jgi:hypothetical protein